MGTRAGYLFVLGANFFWGLNFVLAKVMSTAVPPVALAFWRWAIAALVLAPLIVSLWKMRARVFRHWVFFLFSGLTGVAIYHIFIYTGAHTSNAYSFPLIVAFSGVLVKVCYVFLGKKVSKTQAAGGALATVGLVVLLCRGKLENLLSIGFVVGDLWMLGAALLWAIYSIILEKKPAGQQPFTDQFTMILFGLPLLAVLYGVEASHTGPFAVSAMTVAVIAYLAVFPSVVSYWFWMIAIDRLGAVRTHALYYTLPLFAACQASLILDEELFFYHGVAALTIITGAIMTTVQERAATSPAD